VPVAVSLGAMMLPSLTVSGVLEGLYTLFAISLVRKANLRGVSA
jgi:cobalt/nickel transport system permease protein